MRLSDKGADLLKGIEDLRLEPYDDQTGEPIDEWCKGATIGYGHLISRTYWPIVCGGITRPQAEALFWSDIAPFERVVNSMIKVPIQQHQFDALVILAYNIGTYGFSASSVARMINDPYDKPYPSLEAAWKAWHHSGGVDNPGLVNRRAAEWTLFTTGRYAGW